jgi:hypothetical protein
MRTDGQTDTTKLIVAFRNFAKAPKIICACLWGDGAKVCKETLQITHLSLNMAVRVPACYLRSCERIFVKFDTGSFNEFVEIFKFE